MQTPYGVFEPEFELPDLQIQSLQRSLNFLEHIRTELHEHTPIHVEMDDEQPLLVTVIHEKRLEIPIFEVLQQDCRRLAGTNRTLPLPLRIDGIEFHGLVDTSAGPMVDSIVSLLLVILNEKTQLLPPILKDALGIGRR
jgi:hypothetical protein